MSDPTFSSGEDIASLLIDAGCVSARSDEPFRLPSGWASPVYMDCRRLISYPEVRRAIVSASLSRLRSAGALDAVDSIAGGEASGIALAAWMAEALNLPMQLVRKRPVGLSHVEGVVQPGSRVLLVDDLMAAGQSKITFIRALADTKAVVKDLLVVFSYGTFDADAMLVQQGVRVHALTTWSDVLAVANKRNVLPLHARQELALFLQNPGQWSQIHGGISRPSYFS